MTVSDQDITDRNFVFDIYVLMVKNLNPFSLERKLTTKSKHEMLDLLWKDCMPNDFYNFICKKENFSYLNGKSTCYIQKFQTLFGRLSLKIKITIKN